MNQTQRNKVAAILSATITTNPTPWATICDAVGAKVKVQSWLDVRGVLQGLVKMGSVKRTSNVHKEEYVAVPLYLVEFPEFGALPFDPTALGLEDTSWHNDACPSFSVLNDSFRLESLWMDHEDPKQREMQGPRFLYCTYDPKGEHSESLETLLDTDDVVEARRFLELRLTQRIGDAFAAGLLKEIGKRKYEQVRKSNAVHAINSDVHVCASHDFCDANMTMFAAYCAVLGVKEEDVPLPSATEDQTLTDRMNAAWTHAKARHLTAGKGAA